MILPNIIRNRLGFAIAGGLIGGLFAAYEIHLGGAYPDDRMKTLIGAILGGSVVAALFWPKSIRTALRMIVLGLIITFMAIWVSQFAVGFFSEREVSSRQQGLGTWGLSFIGTVLMGALLSLFALLKTLGLPLLLGGFVGWLFRDDKVA